MINGGFDQIESQFAFARSQGVAGVRTLVLMGCYGRPEMGPALSYEPSREGNERLRG